MELPVFHHALRIDRNKCIGCTHCMAVCPTAALRVREGKAFLLDNRCVDCGECYRVCPVDAIYVDHDDFNRIFEFRFRVALVPSVFLSQFPEDISIHQVFSALESIGFTHVAEVENGVDVLLPEIVERVRESGGNRPLISSFCPAVVRLIQVRFPSLVNHILPLKPPLDITALFYKQYLMSQGAGAEETGIFYVTPCAAKIAAVKSPVGEKMSSITGVINMDFLFNKLLRGIKQNRWETCPVSFNRDLPDKNICWSLTHGESRHIPGRCLAIDEIRNVIEFLEKVEDNQFDDLDFLELRACDQGCPGGILTSSNRFLTVERMQKRAAGSKTSARPAPDPVSLSLHSLADYLKSSVGIDRIKPRSMDKLDEDFGLAMQKFTRVRELVSLLPSVDCGVCGAPTCQALAEDIVQDKAHIHQCIFIGVQDIANGRTSANSQLEIMRKIWEK